MPVEKDRDCRLPTFGKREVVGAEDEEPAAYEIEESLLTRRQRRFERSYPLQPVFGFVPSLHEAGSFPVRYKPTCQSVLSALSLQGSYWDGHWDLDALQKERLLLAVKPGLGVLKGNVTLDDLMRFSEREDNREMVLKMPGACHGILVEEAVKDAFHLFDADDSGCLDRREWNHFLEAVEQFHTKCLLTHAHMDFRAFFGRRYKWSLTSTRLTKHELLEAAGEVAQAAEVEAEASWFLPRRKEYVRYVPDIIQCPCGDTSSMDSWADWFADLHYYSANNHPFHGILAADAANRLSRLERLAIELATFGFMLQMELLRTLWVDQHKAPLEILSTARVFNLVMVTIPGMLFWKLSYTLFTCPCANISPARSSIAQRIRAMRMTHVSEAIGYTITAAGILSLIYVARSCAHGEPMTTTQPPRTPWDTPPPSPEALPYEPYHTCVHSLYLPVLFARAYSYVISWVLFLVLNFNPFFAFGQPDPEGTPMCFADLIGLGQWTIEKQRFQMHCLQAALKRGSVESGYERIAAASTRICRTDFSGH